MNIIKLMDTQLSEFEATIYMLLDAGDKPNTLATKLGVSNHYIVKTYDRAKSKLKQPVEKS
jgi:hypothetical protein